MIIQARELDRLLLADSTRQIAGAECPHLLA